VNLGVAGSSPVGRPIDNEKLTQVLAKPKKECVPFLSRFSKSGAVVIARFELRGLLVLRRALALVQARMNPYEPQLPTACIPLIGARNVDVVIRGARLVPTQCTRYRNRSVVAAKWECKSVFKNCRAGKRWAVADPANEFLLPKRFL